MWSVCVRYTDTAMLKKTTLIQVLLINYESSCPEYSFDMAYCCQFKIIWKKKTTLCGQMHIGESHAESERARKCSSVSMCAVFVWRNKKIAIAFRIVDCCMKTCMLSTFSSFFYKKKTFGRCCSLSLFHARKLDFLISYVFVYFHSLVLFALADWDICMCLLAVSTNKRYGHRTII